MTSPSATGLPPIDHIARELWKRGAREAALDLLRACVMRDPTARASAALLRAVEARPDASVSGPEIELDLVLVDALAGQGMILEARALLVGTKLAITSEGQDRAARYDTVLATVPAELDKRWHEVMEQVHLGAGRHALTLIENEEANGNAAPPWMISRRDSLREILSVTAVDRPSVRPPGSQSRHAVGVNPTEMMQTQQEETTKISKPMRKASLELVTEEQGVAPTMALSEVTVNETTQPALRKRRPSQAPGGTYARKVSPSGTDLGEAATTNLSLDQEAELLVRQGYPEQALTLYRALMTQPGYDPRLDTRCAELEMLIAERAAPVPNEVTVRRQDAALLRAATRTDAMPSVRPSDMPVSGVMPTMPAPDVNAPMSNATVLVRRIVAVG